MDLDDIAALIRAMAASDLTTVEVTKDGWTLRLTRGAAEAPVQVPAPAAAVAKAPAAPAPVPVQKTPQARPAADTAVLSPLSGVVHFRAAPDAPPLVEAGREVAAGDVLFLVEAMKMFNEVRAERAGTVEALLVSAGADVDAGQPVLRVS